MSGDLLGTYCRTIYPSYHSGISIGNAILNSFGMEMCLVFPGTGKNDSDKLPLAQFVGKFGLEFGILRAENTYFSYTYASSSATINGSSEFQLFRFPVGVGVNLNPVNFITISMAACYKPGFVTGVSGTGGNDDDYYEVEDNVGAGGYFLEMGMNVNIPFPSN